MNKGFESRAGNNLEPCADLVWPDDPAHIPDWIYTDPRIYELEQERIFRGRSWIYVGLECEVPKPGDYIRSFVGSVPVVVARDADGKVQVFENRCAHRGVEFCRNYRGNTTQFICPYHNWTYDLRGKLIGVPFRRGVKGKGGMPAGFDMNEHDLRQVTVTTRGGAIFATFCEDMESLEEYLGPTVIPQFDSTFDGRRLTLLGLHRNTLECNWKLYQENLKDPYHATLLHTYLTTFGLFVAGNKSEIDTDRHGRHHVSLSVRPEGRPQLAAQDKADISAFRETMTLSDPRVMEYVREFNSPWSNDAMTIWPNLSVLRQLNIISIRQIVPRGPNELMMIWTACGYEGDSEEMTQHRLRQNNIFGPGGFLGIEDNEALKFVQQGLTGALPRGGLALLGNDNESTDTVITDRAIRAMYGYYRKVMGL